MRTDDEVSFPVPGHCPVSGLEATVVDRQHRLRESPASADDAGVPAAAQRVGRPAQQVGALGRQVTAGGDAPGLAVDPAWGDNLSGAPLKTGTPVRIGPAP